MALAFLRLIHVRYRTKLSRSTIYARIAAGKFPKPVRLGPRAVGWLEHEIEAYLAALVAATRGKHEQNARQPHSPMPDSIPIGMKIHADRDRGPRRGGEVARIRAR